MSLSRREQTELRIMQAFEEQILETGMKGVGVNAIAKRAGVSKELIYRYFDGLPGLMLQWMYSQDFWTGKSNMLFGEPLTNHANPNDKDAADASTENSRTVILAMLHAQAKALFENKALREIRRWELIEKNELSTQLAKRRESVARAFINRLCLANPESEVDIPASVGILLAGILYLVLRSKTESHFLGVPIRTEDGWERIFSALEHLVECLPNEPVNLPKEQ